MRGGRIVKPHSLPAVPFHRDSQPGAWRAAVAVPCSPGGFHGVPRSVALLGDRPQPVAGLSIGAGGALLGGVDDDLRRAAVLVGRCEVDSGQVQGQPEQEVGVIQPSGVDVGEPGVACFDRLGVGQVRCDVRGFRLIGGVAQRHEVHAERVDVSTDLVWAGLVEHGQCPAEGEWCDEPATGGELVDPGGGNAVDRAGGDDPVERGCVGQPGRTVAGVQSWPVSARVQVGGCLVDQLRVDIDAADVGCAEPGGEVKSARSAVLVSRPARFSEPLPAPAVRLSSQRALHKPR